MTLYVGQTNEAGHVLIFDKWANEVNCRVEAWRLQNGDVRIVFVHAGVGYQPSLTLTSYRADDLCKALATPGAPGDRAAAGRALVAAVEARHAREDTP